MEKVPESVGTKWKIICYIRQASHQTPLATAGSESFLNWGDGGCMVWLFAATAPEEEGEGRRGEGEETRASTHCHRKSTACTRRHTWTGTHKKEWKRNWNWSHIKRVGEIRENISYACTGLTTCQTCGGTDLASFGLQRNLIIVMFISWGDSFPPKDSDHLPSLTPTYRRRVHACGGRRHSRNTHSLLSRDKEVFASDLFPFPFVLALFESEERTEILAHGVVCLTLSRLCSSVFLWGLSSSSVTQRRSLTARH